MVQGLRVVLAGGPRLALPFAHLGDGVQMAVHHESRRVRGDPHESIDPTLDLGSLEGLQIHAVLVCSAGGWPSPMSRRLTTIVQTLPLPSVNGWMPARSMWARAA